MGKARTQHRRLGVALAAALLLSSCATSTRLITPERLHQACAEQTGSFVTHASCMDVTLRDPALPGRVTPELQIYVAHSLALAERIVAGRIGEAEARYEQISLRQDLARRRQARADAAGDDLIRRYEDAQRARRSKPIITCSSINGMVNCF